MNKLIDKFNRPIYSIKSDDEILSSFARIGIHPALWYIDCTYGFPISSINWDGDIGIEGELVKDVLRCA